MKDMLRTEKIDFEFNQDAFALAIKQAMGQLSTVAFAEKTGLSRSYISRCLNKKLADPPVISSLKKIAAATDTITYAELLDACGYDSKKYASEPLLFEEDAWTPVNTILPALFETRYKWSYNANIRPGEPFIVGLEHAPFKAWCFIPIRKKEVSKEDVINIFLNDLASSISLGTKVSFVTDDDKLFTSLSKEEFLDTPFRLSVILVEPYVVKREIYIKSARQISKEEEHFRLPKREKNKKILSIESDK